MTPGDRGITGARRVAITAALFPPTITRSVSGCVIDRLSSKPTQTLHTTRGVNPTNQASR